MSSISITTTTIISQPYIPLLTPAPDCFNDIWAEPEPCDHGTPTLCSIFSLGKFNDHDINNDDCTTFSAWLPGTDCPISYTKEYFSSSEFHGTTRGWLTCCPSWAQQTFTYTETGFNSVLLCIAVSASLPGPSPWTVPLSPPITNGATTTASAVFDPEKDTLIAQPLLVTFVVENGTTCAETCMPSYTGGTEWVSPPRDTATETPRCDYLCGYAEFVMIVSIVVPSVFSLLCLGCCCWCVISNRRRNVEERRMREWRAEKRREQEQRQQQQQQQTRGGEGSGRKDI